MWQPATCHIEDTPCQSNLCLVSYNILLEHIQKYHRQQPSIPNQSSSEASLLYSATPIIYRVPAAYQGYSGPYQQPAMMPSLAGYCTCHGYMPGSSRANTKKRTRSCYKISQVEALEKEFGRNEYLTREQRSEIACKIGMSEQKVKIWFQNKRMKKKKGILGKKQKESGTEELESIVEGMTSATAMEAGQLEFKTNGMRKSKCIAEPELGKAREKNVIIIDDERSDEHVSTLKAKETKVLKNLKQNQKENMIKIDGNSCGSK